MKRAFQIFKRDIKRLSHNWVALIVIVGVCIIPSLYAWFNIAANHDPYSNTQNIKIAVADNDKGIKNDLIGELNAGLEIKETLKKNDSLGWVFVSEKEAVDGVKSGKYYAAIVIPENFSESMLSFLSGKIEQPEFDYYLNEKKNAIAPKITDTGASTIRTQVNAEFVSAASGTVAKLLNSSVSELGNEVSDAQNTITKKLKNVSDNLGEYEKALDNFNKTVKNSNELFDSTRDTLDAVKKAGKTADNTVEDSSKDLKDIRKQISSFSNGLNDSLANGQSKLFDIKSTAGSSLTDMNGKVQSVNTKIDDMIDSVQKLIDQNKETIQALKQLNEKVPGDVLVETIKQLENENKVHQEMLKNLKKGNKSIAGVSKTTVTSIKDISDIIDSNNSQISKYKESVETSVFPQLNESMDSFAQISGKLSGSLSGIDSSVDQTKQIVDKLESGLESINSTMQSTKNAIQKVREQLTSATEDISILQSSNIYKKLSSLTEIDTEKVASFMSEPVQLKTHTFYPVDNYGSAMTPFYTNLAIWVGGIVLIAILKMEVDKDEKIKRFKPSQAYFGRWMLFIILGLIQSFIICVGDILIVKSQCENPAAFIFAGLVASFVYVNLIYALSITFKHIGKAVCVILVILQIPGSAGTYPIEMTPSFFQAIHPLLPFTYGINAMREAMAGIYGKHYLMDLLYLAIFIPIAFLIGLGLRKLMLNLNRFFDKKLEETGLMIGEETGITVQRVWLSAAVQILAGDKTFKDKIESKVELFENKYKKMMEGGFIAILVIPVVFLILMFSISSKMVFLVLWITSIILIALYLIIVEYIHESLADKKKMSQLSGEELIKYLESGKEKVE